MTPRPPLARAFALWVVVMVVTVGGGLLTRAYLPGVDGMVRALLVVEVLFGLTLAAAPWFGSWSELGVNRPREWSSRSLLILPLVLAVSPLALGVRSVPADVLLVLVVGYSLTGFTEELVWRGFAQRLLAPLGSTRAVLVGAAFFGAAHLANVVFRDSVALVVAQAWGAFCFGVAYGALRHRTRTIVPLMVLHAVTDLAAAVGALPKIPMLVAEDVVLLALGLVLLVRDQHPPTMSRLGWDATTEGMEPAMGTMNDQLDRALQNTGTIVSGITAEQWSLPSLCAGWDVRTEANHLVGGLRILTAQLTGETVADDHDGHDWLGADPSRSYADAAVADAVAWRRDNAAGVVFDLAFGQVSAEMALVVHLTEVIVHGLDLAVATGQEHLVDGDGSAALLAMMREMGTEAFRVPGIFGPEVAAVDGAPVHRQLLAFLGRALAPVPAWGQLDLRR